jgi:hypothetical protein
MAVWNKKDCSMNQKFFLSALFVFSCGIAGAQGIVKGSGIIYSDSIPTHSVDTLKEAEIALDVRTGNYYQWSRDSVKWVFSGFRVEIKPGACSAPTYIPGRNQSYFVSDTCGTFYFYNDTLWRQVKGTIADGDKGDITVSGNGLNWNIDAGTIGATELASTSVAPGTYSNATVTVDADGRITNAVNGPTGARGIYDGSGTTGDSTVVASIKKEIQFRSDSTDASFLVDFTPNDLYGTNAAVRPDSLNFLFFNLTGSSRLVIKSDGISAITNTANPSLRLTGNPAIYSADYSPFTDRELPDYAAVKKIVVDSVQVITVTNDTAYLSRSGGIIPLKKYAQVIDTFSRLNDTLFISLSNDNAPAVSAIIDGSSTNEIQDLSLSGQTLSLSNDPTTVTLPVIGVSGGTGITTSSSGGTVTVTNAAPDQTVSISGSGITTVTGTYPVFTVTSTENDGSTSNEGSLTVGAGIATTSVISSNTSGSTNVTIEAGSNITLSESGNTITIASTAAGVTDGDKDDITVSGSGANWNIRNDSVTSPKILDGTIALADMGANSVDSTKVGDKTLSLSDLNGAWGVQNGFVLKWNGSNWRPGADNTGADGNGIYGGDGDIPTGTDATLPLNSFFRFEWPSGNTAFIMDDFGDTVYLADPSLASSVLVSASKVGLRSTGNIELWGGTGGAKLRMLEPTGSGTNYTEIQVGAQSTDITYTLPTTTGSNGQYLQFTTGGQLQWSTVAAGVTDGDKDDITVSGSGANWNIRNDSVTSPKILDGTIALVDMGANSVDSTKIGDKTVSLSDLNGAWGANAGSVLKWDGNNWRPGTDNNTDAQTLSINSTTVGSSERFAVSISSGNTVNFDVPQGTVTSVGITQPAAGITVTNSPVTTSGNISLALANDLGAVEGLTTNGIAVRTGDNTWTTRSIAGAADPSSTALPTINDFNGVNGNPTISISTSTSTTKLTALVATTANITLSGTQTIDGVALSADNRVLVKNQNTASQNGLYVVRTTAWVRATDLDANTELNNGVLVYISRGTANGGKYFRLATSTEPPLTITTSALSFSETLGAGVTDGDKDDITVSNSGANWNIRNDSVTTPKILNGTILFEDIGQNSASPGQVIKWNGTAWAAAADNTGGSGSTDLSWTGASSPYTLNSSSGTDVDFAQGGGITLSTSGATLTIAATDQSTTNELQTLSTATNTVTLSNSGGSFTIAGGGINAASTSGSTITITGTEVDGSTTNEIQDLSLSGQTLSLSSDATTVTLPVIAVSAGTGISTSSSGGTVTVTNSAPDQTVGITGTGITVVSNYPNFTLTAADQSASNEVLTISDGTNTEALGGQTLTVAGGGINTASYNATTNTLTISGTENDGSTSNEGILGVGAGSGTTATITTNTTTGNAVTIAGGGIVAITKTTGTNGGTITITGTEADGSTTNELQTLSTATNTVTLSNSGGSFTISGAGINTASTSGSTITITGTENDGSTTNELQTLSTATNTVTLSNSGGSFTIAGGGINTVSTSGSTITVTGTENDGSTTNELQTIANTSDATSHTVTLSNSGGSVQLIQGAGIDLTTGGNSGAGTVTIAATNSGTVTSVGITAPAAGITVSNSPITSSGNITLALADDLAAVEGLTSIGVAVRTNNVPPTWTTRSLTVANPISIQNATGASDNPFIYLNNGDYGDISIANSNLPLGLRGDVWTIDANVVDSTNVGNNTLSVDDINGGWGVQTGSVLKWNGTNWRPGTDETGGGGGGVTDGDKGDITVSASGATWTIDNTVVNYAKIQNISNTNRILGRATAGAGSVEEITVGGDLTQSGSNFTVANDAITFAKMQNSAAAGLSVVGRSANSAGDFAEINAGTDGFVLRRSGTTLGFGTVATAGIADAAVTYAKIQNVAGNSVLARTASGSGTLSEVALSASNLLGRGSTGNVSAITLGSNLSMSGTALNTTGHPTITGTPTTNAIPKWTSSSALGSTIVQESISGADTIIQIVGRDALRLPLGTTAERPGTPTIGMTRYNTTNGAFEYYDADAWETPLISATGTGLGTAGNVFFADANGRASGSTNLFWDATNSRLGVGTSSPQSQFHFVTNVSGDPSNFVVERYTANANIIQRRANGTIASPTACLNGDVLGANAFRGHNGTAFASLSSVVMLAVATENWTTSANGARFTINTIPNGATSGSARFTINHNGNVNIGSGTSPENRLQIEGTLGRNAPVSTDATAYVMTNDVSTTWLICDETATTTITLPAASSWSGRELTIKNITAFAVNSNASNVLPIGSNTAGTAILSATAGSWALLVSNGTNWVIMQRG